MEEIGTTNPEYQPLQGLWCPFVHPCSQNHPLAPIHTFTKQIHSTFIVSRIIDQHLVAICFTNSSHAAYKPLPSLGVGHFFLVSFFLHFLAHLFRGLAGAYMNPTRLSVLVHSLVCSITHSFLDGFQPNLVQHFSHIVCSTCHTVFSLKKTLECVITL